MTSDPNRQESVRSVNGFSTAMASQQTPPPAQNGHALVPSQQQQQQQPPGPSLGEQDKARLIEEILLSDVGVKTLLNRLKQSITACREFSAFIKRRASLEEEHAQGLRKLCSLTHTNIRRPECRQGTYARSFEETTRIHGRMAENGLQFSLALQQMHDDLTELGNNMDRGKKHWKQTGLAFERKVQDAEMLVEKAKNKYDTAAEEYDRAKSGDRRAGKSPFSIRGTKKGPQHEEDLYRKVQIADGDYSARVQQASAARAELISSLRPSAVRSLREMVAECDSGLTVQLQRFAQLNEKYLLSNGLSVSPIKSENPDARSMRDVISLIDNEKDFENYILDLAATVPLSARNQEVKYERHSSLTSSGPNPNSALPNQPMPQGAHQQAYHHQQSPQPVHQPVHQPVLQSSQQQIHQSNHQPTRNITPDRDQKSQIPQSQGFGAVVQAPVMFPSHNSQQISVPAQYAGSHFTGVDYPKTRPVFGQSLEALSARDESVVPILVYQCIQAVDLYGLDVEGIYRLSGEKKHVERLKLIFDNDPSSVDFRKQEDFLGDVNSVASILKQFFRDLPDPLLTNDLYKEFIAASRIDDDITRRDSLHELINRLPDPNYATLRAVILHLNRVQMNSNANRMNSGNLAICFGPTLMGSNLSPNIADAGWQVRCVDTILQNCFSIFDDDV